MLHYTGNLLRLLVVLAAVSLYFYRLAGVGLIGPDEPRYAAIGREMAGSGDWITPRLWGEPWFEKPGLLYWMIATSHVVGLRDEWAARAGVAALSLAFLAFFWWIIRRNLGDRTAAISTLIVATSAGWLAYSFAAVTDLPMTVFLISAMLAAIFEEKREGSTGALLGLAVLAKGLVPLVLFVPFLWWVRRRLLIFAAGFAIAAGPWYALVWLKNGNEFFAEFFWRHHFERFFSGSLLHLQPAWYFLPVLAAGMFPWTPLFCFLRKPVDLRMRFLGAWALFAFVFFSISANKLPGYILPIIPVVSLLLGSAVAEAKRAGLCLAASAALLVMTPTLANMLPDGLLLGLSKAQFQFAPAGLAFAAAAVGAWWLESRGRRVAAVALVAVSTGIAVAYLKFATFPVLDRQVSVRAFWRAIEPRASEYCIDDQRLRRAWVYGLQYYGSAALEKCSENSPRIRITDDDLLRLR